MRKKLKFLKGNLSGRCSRKFTNIRITDKNSLIKWIIEIKFQIEKMLKKIKDETESIFNGMCNIFKFCILFILIKELFHSTIQDFLQNFHYIFKGYNPELHGKIPNFFSSYRLQIPSDENKRLKILISYY